MTTSPSYRRLVALLSRLAPGHAIMSGLGILSVPLLTRGLGLTEYGRLGVIWALSSFTTGIVLEPILQGRLRARPLEGAFSRSSLQPGVRALSLLGLVIGLLLLSQVRRPTPPHFLLAAISLSAASFGLAFARVEAQAMFDRRSYSLSSAALAVAKYLVPTIFIFWPQNSVRIAAASAMLAGVLSFLTCKNVAPRPGIKRLAAELLESARFGLPIAGFVLGSWIINVSDRLILAALAPAAETGGYIAVSQAVAGGVGVLWGLLVSGFYPTAVRAYEAGQLHAEALYWQRVSDLLFLTLLLAPVAFSRQVLAILGVPIFGTQGAFILAALAGGACLWGVTLMNVKSRELARRTWPMLFITLGAGAFNLILNIMLIPRLGAPGAAAATVLSYASALGLSFTKREGVIVVRPLRAASYVGAVAAACAYGIYVAQ